MISITCSQCGSRLNAKDELEGQTRKCPKCGTPITITREPAVATVSEPTGLAGIEAATAGSLMAPAGDETIATPTAEAAIQSPTAPGLPTHHYLDRLGRHNYYAILDRTRVFAVWENNGQGWMLKTGGGLVSAVRNNQLLPSQGDFRLVELKLQSVDAAIQLAGLAVYKLAQHFALASLARGDDDIVGKIVGQAGLSRDQKNAIRNVIKERFMRSVWENVPNITEYLSNNDMHTPGTG